MNGGKLEQIIYERFKSFVKDNMPIGGKIYYRGLRPIQENSSSYKEDAVIGFLTGVGGDLQEGSLVINVYVPDVLGAKSGLYLMNKSRCDAVADALEKFVSYVNSKGCEVFLKQSEMIYTFAEEAIRQHFVSLKLDFKVLNTNY